MQIRSLIPSPGPGRRWVHVAAGLRPRLAVLVVCSLCFLPKQGHPAVESKGKLSRPVLGFCVTNKFGDVLTNLAVAKVLPDGLLLENSSSQVKVRFVELPPEIQKNFHSQALEAGAKSKQDLENAKATDEYLSRLKPLMAEEERLRQRKEILAQSPYLRLRPTDRLPEPPPAPPTHTVRLLNNLKVTFFQGGTRNWSSSLPDGSWMEGKTYPGTNGCTINFQAQKIPPGGLATHRAAYNFFWGQRQKEADLTVADLEKFVKVSSPDNYGIAMADYYFAAKGQWVEFHISKSPPDEKLFAEFEQYLSYN